MNEVKSLQEKELNSILNTILNLSETRDKLIYEIDDIIDRIAQNREPSCEPAKTGAKDLVNNPPVFISVLRDRVTEMDLANEKLRAISNRLNKLI